MPASSAPLTYRRRESVTVSNLCKNMHTRAETVLNRVRSLTHGAVVAAEIGCSENCTLYVNFSQLQLTTTEIVNVVTSLLRTRHCSSQAAQLLMQRLQRLLLQSLRKQCHLVFTVFEALLFYLFLLLSDFQFPKALSIRNQS